MLRRALLFCVLSLASLATGTAAAGAATDPAPAATPGPLSPGLAELARPAVRALGERAQALRIGVAPSGPGSLLRDGDRVLVEVRTEGPPRLGPLRAAGARIVAVDRALRRVTASVDPADLEGIAALGQVGAVEAVPAPIVAAVDCEGGSVVSEGVAQLNVAAAREDHAVNGAGVTVGVLSDSFDQATTASDGSGPIATEAATDVETGDLPGAAVPGSGECAGEETPVDALSEYTLGSSEVFDEGRAMLQTVHDVAPAAKLAFASAFNGELAFAEAIEELARPSGEGGAGASVLVDDVSYLEEPFFQNGPIADAVESVVAEGIPYVSAAGNNNLLDAEGHAIASWETPAFRDAGSCPAGVVAVRKSAAHCLDFDPGPGTDTGFGIAVEPKRTLTVDLQWDEPWYGVNTNEDAYLLGPEGKVVAKAERSNPTVTKKPVELLQWTNQGSGTAAVALVVNRVSGGTPRTKLALLENGRGVTATEYPASAGGDVVGPVVFGHAGAPGAIAVGATRYDNGLAPERFSSRGPVTHYFGPVVGATPAAPLPAPEVIPKPDVTATDCGATTFFASRDAAATWRFCGTSQAAPHVAGVVALMGQAATVASVPASPAAVRSALASAAVPLAADACAVGAGLVEADGAIEALLTGTAAAPPACQPPTSSPTEASGSGGSDPPGVVVPVAPVVPPPETPIPKPPAAVAPATRVVQHPGRIIRTSRAAARVRFAFASDQPGAGFLCQVERGPYRACAPRVVRFFGLGPHVFRVRATVAGLADPTPAVVRFKVVRAR